MATYRKIMVICLFFITGLLSIPAEGNMETGTDKKKEIIGIAKIVSHPALDGVEQGIQDELNSLGYNFQYDLQNANGEISTAASIANKFKTERVKIAVGIATPAAQALVNTISDVPVIFSAVTDPVTAGLVENLEHGNGNVTGVSDMTPVREQIKLLARMVNLKRLGHVYCSSETNAVVLAGIARKVCSELGIQFVEATVTNSAEVKQAVQSLIGRVDGLYLSNDNTIFSAISAVSDVAIQNGIPLMSADPSSATEFPVLAAWGFDYYKMGRATGRLIAEILKGKKPADIPTRFMTETSDVDLIINLDIAKKIGIKVPADILRSASGIIENGKLTGKQKS